MRGAWIIGLLLTAACATGDVKTQLDATADLAAFDKANPNCELWTNWEKMCSRTGAKGETFCKEDPAMPVKASAPFCVVDKTESFDLVDTYTKPEYESYARFCAKKSSNKSGHLRGSPEAVAYCARYVKERPFNGRHLEARRHPLCRNWKTLTGNDLLLQEEADNPNRGSLDCTKTDCSTVVVEAGLSCRQDRTPDWCGSINWMSGWAVREADLDLDPGANAAQGDPNRVVVPVSHAYFRPDIAVVGAYCRRAE